MLVNFTGFLFVACTLQQSWFYWLDGPGGRGGARWEDHARGAVDGRGANAARYVANHEWFLVAPASMQKWRKGGNYKQSKKGK